MVSVTISDVFKLEIHAFQAKLVLGIKLFSANRVLFEHNKLDFRLKKLEFELEKLEFRA